MAHSKLEILRHAVSNNIYLSFTLGCDDISEKDKTFISWVSDGHPYRPSRERAHTHEDLHPHSTPLHSTPLHPPHPTPAWLQTAASHLYHNDSLAIRAVAVDYSGPAVKCYDLRSLDIWTNLMTLDTAPRYTCLQLIMYFFTDSRSGERQDQC